MRKICFALVFMLVGSFAFANGNLTKELNSNGQKIEKISDFVIANFSIIEYFDICTITVTIIYSDGVTVRGRATSHTGDCDAARSAALAAARENAASIGY